MCPEGLDIEDQSCSHSETPCSIQHSTHPQVAVTLHGSQQRQDVVLPCQERNLTNNRRMQHLRRVCHP